MPAEIRWLHFLLLDAQTAVNLFLVLSGFLITYLLFEEQSAAGLDTGRFLLRRMLRILPLYYTTVFIGLCLVPLLLGPLSDWGPLSLPRLVLVLLLLPIFATSLGPLEHLWCIGLLSQFYLLWPWVVRRPAAAFLKILLGILIVKTAVAPVIVSFHSVPAANLFLGLRFESLAIGALGAYALLFKKPVVKTLCSLPGKSAALFLLAVLAVWDLPFTEPAILLSSCVFMLFILNFCTGSSVGRKLEHPLVERLGGLSYGIYMFHYPLLYCLLHLFTRMGIPEGSSYTALLHASVIGGTLLLAGVFYYWVERPFLRMKKRFTVIPTRT
jgi:peptidoglycan/LPS O-acetylase OafA/YrhL